MFRTRRNGRGLRIVGEPYESTCTNTARMHRVHENKRRVTENLCNPLLGMLARLQGFEPRAHGLEVRCSIHLSYRRIDWLEEHL